MWKGLRLPREFDTSRSPGAVRLEGGRSIPPISSPSAIVPEGDGGARRLSPRSAQVAYLQHQGNLAPATRAKVMGSLQLFNGAALASVAPRKSVKIPALRAPGAFAVL